MSESITLNVQKWVYERGNYQIVVENAWNLSAWRMYSQERIRVNGETVRDNIAVSQSIVFWRTVFEDTVIDSTGELNLIVQWKSGLKTIKSRLLIDDERQNWTHYFVMEWQGNKGEWPDQFDYEANAGQ